jgi:hypothetical protein
VSQSFCKSYHILSESAAHFSSEFVWVNRSSLHPWTIGENTKHPVLFFSCSFVEKELLQRPCLWNGLKRICYLFARKFYPKHWTISWAYSPIIQNFELFHGLWWCFAWSVLPSNLVLFMLIAFSCSFSICPYLTLLREWIWYSNSPLYQWHIHYLHILQFKWVYIG